MYSIKEVIDRKIWVKCSGEDAKKLKDAFGIVGGASGCYGYYRYSPNSPSVPDYDCTDSNPGSFIYFKEINFNSKQTGWKVKSDFENNKIVKNLIGNRKIISLNSQEEKIMEELGTLNIWCEADFTVGYKVGNWVKIVNKRNSHWNSLGMMDEYFGTIQQICNIQKDGSIKLKNLGWDWEFCDFERLATPEEIDELTINSIGGYEVQYLDGKIKVGCTEVSHDIIEKIYKKIFS